MKLSGLSSQEESIHKEGISTAWNDSAGQVSGKQKSNLLIGPHKGLWCPTQNIFNAMRVQKSS